VGVLVYSVAPAPLTCHLSTPRVCSSAGIGGASEPSHHAPRRRRRHLRPPPRGRARKRPVQRHARLQVTELPAHQFSRPKKAHVRPSLFHLISCPCLSPLFTPMQPAGSLWHDGHGRHQRRGRLAPAPRPPQKRHLRLRAPVRGTSSTLHPTLTPCAAPFVSLSTTLPTALDTCCSLGCVPLPLPSW
jgi:hypothetical protein